MKKLQLEIVPPVATNQILIDQAFEAYLDFCESDEHIAPFMAKFHLSREDLKRIYNDLKETPLGSWIDDHYPALSTIAYLEPLYFFVESEKKGESLSDITSDLLEYWEGKIPRGFLLQKVGGEESILF